MINRWRWLNAWKSAVNSGLLSPSARAEYVALYNNRKFFWMQEIK